MEKDTSRLPVLKIRFPMFRGDAVRLLQRRVLHHGIAVVEDGQFGYGTLKAVREFQKAKGLDVSGVVNADTWEKLLAEKE